MTGYRRPGVRGGKDAVSRRRFLRGSGLAVAGALAGVACAAPPERPTAQPAPPTPAGAAPAPAASTPAAPAIPPPKYGGTFSYPFNFEAPHLDVHQTGTALLHAFGPGAAYSRLARFKAGPGVPYGSAIVVGDLAESWDQADEITYVFRLRRGVKFHNLPPVNGREFVAEDVVFSYERQIAQKTNAGFLGALRKVEAPDKYTVKISLTSLDLEYPLTVAGGWNKIVAHEAVEQSGDLKDGPTIGTGPFILEKWEPNSITKMVRNPDYFAKGLPYVDRLEFPRIVDDQTRLAAFRAGQFSTAGPQLTPKDADNLRQQVPNAQFLPIKQPIPGVELSMNSKTGPTADRRVRLAVSKAVDRQALIDTALFGGGFLMTNVALPGPDWLLPEDELRRLYARDLPGARRLLAEAGFPSGLDLEMNVVNSPASLVAVGELMASQIQEAGVRTKITLTDNVTGTDKVKVRNEYQIALGNTSPLWTTNQDLFTRVHSKGGRGGQTLLDPKLDEMIEKQALLRDEAQRKAALLEIQRYLITEGVPAVMVTGQFSIEVWMPTLRDLTAGLPNPAQADGYTYVWFDK
jgi:peptide/nickel transport system substrate-binding protein